MSASKGKRIKYTLRLPPILAQHIKAAAAAAHLSVNDYINEKLEGVEA